MNFPGKTFQSGMVTLFLDEVVKLTFVLLPLDMYLISGVSDNKNLLRGSKEYICVKNVSVAYHFFILSRFTEIGEFNESNLSSYQKYYRSLLI